MKKAVLASLLLMMVGCAGKEAEAKLASKSDSTVTGKAEFTEGSDKKITLKLTVAGATPGQHAVHIHATPDCSAADGTSAGGHWNPTDVSHGKWGVDPYHLGDIGNFEVGSDGTGSLTLTTDKWTIGTDTVGTDVEEHSIIIHAGTDDYTTQPTGASGGRVACGVIEVENE